MHFRKTQTFSSEKLFLVFFTFSPKLLLSIVLEKSPKGSDYNARRRPG